MPEDPFRRAADIALEDQLRGAGRDARALVSRVARSLESASIATPLSVARWLAQAVQEAALRGRLLPCPHLGSSPQLALGIWDGPGVGRVGCAPCLADLTADFRGTAQDRSCDRCLYEVCPGEPWSRLLVASGAVTWTVGLCTDCSADLGLRTKGAQRA